MRWRLLVVLLLVAAVTVTYLYVKPEFEATAKMTKICGVVTELNGRNYTYNEAFTVTVDPDGEQPPFRLNIPTRADYDRLADGIKKVHTFYFRGEVLETFFVGDTCN